MAGLDVKTPPASEPVARADVKAYGNIEGDDQDAVIDALIASARSMCEATLKRSLMPTVWTYRIDNCFPSEIRLPIGPVQADGVASITYVDDAGETQTLATSQYRVSHGDTCIIRPAYGATWPATQPVTDAVTVEFTAGYADADSIPRAILGALWLAVVDLFDNRTLTDSEPVGLSKRLQNMLVPYARH